MEAQAKVKFLELLQKKFTGKDGKETTSFVTSAKYDLYTAIVLGESDRAKEIISAMSPTPQLKHVRQKVLYILGHLHAETCDYHLPVIIKMNTN